MARPASAAARAAGIGAHLRLRGIAIGHLEPAQQLVAAGRGRWRASRHETHHAVHCWVENHSQIVPRAIRVHSHAARDTQRTIACPPPQIIVPVPPAPSPPHRTRSHTSRSLTRPSVLSHLASSLAPSAPSAAPCLHGVVSLGGAAAKRVWASRQLARELLAWAPEPAGAEPAFSFSKPSGTIHRCTGAQDKSALSFSASQAI